MRCDTSYQDFVIVKHADAKDEHVTQLIAWGWEFFGGGWTFSP